MFSKLFQIGIRPGSGSDLLNEKIFLTNKFICAVTIVLVIYLPIYFMIGHIFLFWSMIAGIILMASSIFLNYSRKHTLARHLFLLTGNLLIFSSDVGFHQQAISEAYYLPASLAPFLIFSFAERKNILIANTSPLFLYIFPRLAFNQDFAMSMILNKENLEMVKIVNCIGAFALTNYFAYIFFYSINSFQHRLVSSSTMVSLGEMAAGIAHEINNPLTLITGRVAGIRKSLSNDSQFTEKIKDDLQKIDQTVFRISKIIKGLKSFSRTGEDVEHSNFNLQLVIEDLLSISGEKLRSHQITFSSQVPHDIDVFGNQLQIGQVIINLVNNSIDAISGTSDAWIKIEYKSTDKEHEIYVIDSGAGIAENVVKKMMEPFYTTKPVGKGTGLGLSISRGIMENHKGSLAYLKAPNTCFLLKLPHHEAR